MTKTPKNILLGLVQHACNKQAADNLKQSIAGVRAAAKQGAQLVVLQELHGTHYFCQQQNADNFQYAESIPGPSSEQFSQLAAELNIVIVISIFERRAAGLYHNTAIVLDRQRGIVGQYRKMHIPDDPSYYEKYYFTPGDHLSRQQVEQGAQGFEPINTSAGRLGIMVCWDQWFPEAARLMSLAGADLLLYPTAIGWDPADSQAEQHLQKDAWLTIQRSHAIANGVAVAACNRVGFEVAPADISQPSPREAASAQQGIHFWGNSFIAGPQGEILAQAGSEEAEVIVANIDVSRNERVRQTWPYLRDRRIDAYADLLKRYRC
jgi:N-carbamoylputrescine amidase